MYNAVKKFLASHQHVALPGIGNFSVEAIPAQIDIANRSITSSESKILFNNDKLPVKKGFYDFISKELNIDEEHAKLGFTEFIKQLQDSLNTNNFIYFKGIGRLTKQSTNVLTFQQEKMPEYFPEFRAERIIRKNTTHTVRVGEHEKTSEEMQTVLNRTQTIKKETWWIAAAILAVIGIIAIIFYYIILAR
jgi:nucleoid DNA-binding protein